MSIFDMFRTPAAPAANVPQSPNQGQPGQIPVPATPVTAATPGTAPNGTIPTAPAADPQTPLDKFNDLWKNDPNAKPGGSGDMFNVDPQKLMEAAGKVDFAKVITPEQVAAIQAGGEAGTTAFIQAINAVSQATFAQSALASTKIVEQAINRTKDQFSADLPGMLKRQNLNDSLRDSNPAFSHPAAQPILNALQSQLTQKYPNATVQELQGMAKEYLSSFSDQVNQKPVPVTTTPNGETDWTKFFE